MRCAVARKIESYQARPPEKFRLPQIPHKAAFADKFVGLQPRPRLTNSVAADFQERFNAWRHSSPKYAAGSVPEFIVFDYLVRVKRWKDGFDFKYQYGLFGGRTQYGGFVLDFYIIHGNLAWNVQGLKYHLERTQDRAKVNIQNALLSQRGLRVVSLWEDDLQERPEFTIQAALRGQSTNRHSDNQGFLR